MRKKRKKTPFAGNRMKLDSELYTQKQNNREKNKQTATTKSRWVVPR